jgi:hypothetical protein
LAALSSQTQIGDVRAHDEHPVIACRICQSMTSLVV